MCSIVFRKNGGFYSVYGSDTYIMYYLFNYRIIDNRVGFPVTAINKIINTLDEKNINYENPITSEKINYKRKNNYNKYIELGKRKYSIDYRINDILTKLNTLDTKKIEEILSFIEAKI